MSNKLIKPLVLTTFNSTGLTGSFKVVNTNGLDGPCFMLRIVNKSTVPVTISFDGTLEHDYVLSNDTLNLVAPYDPNGLRTWRKGLKVYVKGAAGVGLIYLTGYYID